MTLPSATALAFAASLALAVPAFAQNAVSPLKVLAGKKTHGFGDRAARIGSIMGPELSGATPIRLPTKPAWTRPRHREADASAGLR